MIPRRAFLAGALAAVPFAARARVPRLAFSGSMEQGSLVVGRAEAGARIVIDDEPVHVSPEGIFTFGFAYDRTKAAHIVAHFADGGSETRDTTPVLRHYDIQAISGLPEKYVTPPPEMEERIKRENALVAAVRKRDSDGTFFADGFDWPASGIVSGVFGSQRILNGEPKAPHFGVDIAAPDGTPIHAPADGTVSLAEPDFYLTGGTTLLDHGEGVSTSYLHQSELRVKVGDSVKRGQLIGLVGHKGRATGPHLHWAMNWFQVRLDPSRSTRTPAPERA